MKCWLIKKGGLGDMVRGGNSCGLWGGGIVGIGVDSVRGVVLSGCEFGVFGLWVV